MSVAATYRWARLGPHCVQQWADLSNLLARADGTEEFVDAEDLADELTSTTFDPELDSWAIWSGSDLIGWGHINVPTTASYEGVARMFLLGGIHPDHRRRGIGRTLIEKQEERALELAAARHPGREAAWLTEGGVEGADVRGLLSARGYQVVRYFARMVCSLSSAIPSDPATPETPVPDGIHLRAPVNNDQAPLRLAHNDAFRDHWGSGEKSEEAWTHERSARSSRPAFDSMAVNERGEILSYVLCAQWVPRELYIDVVGTVRGERGRGLALACLRRTIAVAAASGDYDLVDLWVDSVSPTGATRLYQRVGFRHDKTMALLRRAAPSAT